MDSYQSSWFNSYGMHKDQRICVSVDFYTASVHLSVAKCVTSMLIFVLCLILF